MSCMEGKAWIKYHESVLNSVYDVNGETLYYTTKAFHGPFDSYYDAVEYLKGAGWKDAEIYDFT